MGARYGKEWTARGGGTLATLRFQVLDPDGLASLAGGESTLLSSGYAQRKVRWAGGLAEKMLPEQPLLRPNFPNPFNPTTAIPLVLPHRGEVHVEIYDILGQRVNCLASGMMEAGVHTLIWNGRDQQGRRVGSGAYLCLLRVGDFRQQRKMILVK